MEKPCKTKLLSVNLDDYVIKIARQKAQVMFRGNLDYYINWLICNNNKQETKKIVNEMEKQKEKRKPVPIPNTDKTAMYNNVCDYCKKSIYQGEEICKAEGYEKYIHKRCCRNIET